MLMKDHKTYLITGVAGFIGSNLAERLLKDGHTVVGIDDMSTGTQENLDILEKYKTFTFFERSVSAKWFEEVFDWIFFLNRKIDCIFHMAALARIQPAIQDPESCLTRNVLGLMNILEAMRKFKIKNIVFSSSSSIYGLKHVNSLPLKESYESDCLNQYSWSKFAGEQLIKVYCDLYGLSGVCLRYFNVYGERECLNADQYSPVVGLFFQQVLRDKKDMTIVGDGLQTRDMTQVNDVVEANIKAAKQCEKGFKGEVFNVGTGQDISILDLAKLIQKELKQREIESSYIYVKPRVGEARLTRADISKAKKFLDWEPKDTLQQNISAHAEYYLRKYGYFK